MKFCFGDIVVVETNLIGVIVKSWVNKNKTITHEVYVRYFNEIRNYPEETIQRYMVRHKYLSGEEIIWQDNAVNDNIDILCTIDKPTTKIKQNRHSSCRNKLFYSEVVPILKNSKYYNKILCTKAINCLYRADKCTLNEIINITPEELKRIWQLGKATRKYIVDTFRDYVKANNIVDEIITISDYDI